jgi:hypothetical protein
MTGDELDPKTRARYERARDDCDCDPWAPGHAPRSADNWVCPDCGQTWFYASLGLGMGWYRS